MSHFWSHNAAGAVLALALTLSPSQAAAEPSPIAAQCTATDGDTIRCGDERIRLLGIDAPELGGCRKGRRCVQGDGKASRAALARAMKGKALSIKRAGEDAFGRTLGVVYASGVNLSCAQIERGQAEYVARWDNRDLVRRDCPELTR
ncbi:thermonuclease family protein [Erythrobacter sp. HA6-11]